jgi:hypothetical protein
MNSKTAGPGFVVNEAELPADFPTHRHEPSFWEELGRVVASFGFLEETLGRAIFAFTATTEYSDDEIGPALERWGVTLEKAATDALGAQINAYEKAVRAHGRLDMGNFDLLIADLKASTEVRNALCHGSWRPPDQSGASIPFFIDRKLRKFETPVTIEFLKKTRQHVRHLAVAVVGTVTSMGWQFPGGPEGGKRIWPARDAASRG